MTVHDRSVFQSSFERMARMSGMKLEPHTLSDWWDQLERYPIAAVTSALRDCHKESGRFKPTAGLVEQLAARACGDVKASAHDNPTRYYTDASGQVQAEYRCRYGCCDTGWRAKVKATGTVIGEEELQRRRANAPGDTGHLATSDYAMVRCQCKLPARQGAA